VFLVKLSFSPARIYPFTPFITPFLSNGMKNETSSIAGTIAINLLRFRGVCLQV
jgi:hypothetical protein